MQRNHTTRAVSEAEAQIDENAKPLPDLTRFQIDLLITVGRLQANDDPIGLDVKEFLDNRYNGEEIHHGRLYPNLQKLENKGLIKREARDRRSQTIALTDQAKRDLEALEAWVSFDIPADSGGG